MLTIVVRSQFGEETFLCNGSACVLGSGTRWLFTGVAIASAFVGTAGYRWSARLERRGRLDPTTKWAVPDAQEIVEVLFVILAALATYWLVLNGPSIERLEVRQVNQWANDLRNFRLEENTVATDLVPTSRTWFVVGAILATPFAFSFGAMIGREFFGWRRRKAAPDAGEDFAPTATPMTVAPPALSRASFDLDDSDPTDIDELDSASLDTADDDASSVETFDLDRFEIELENDLDSTADSDD